MMVGTVYIYIVVAISHERVQKVTNFINLFQLIDTVDQLYILYKACQFINTHINKNRTKYMYLSYIYMHYSPMVPKINR